MVGVGPIVLGSLAATAPVGRLRTTLVLIRDNFRGRDFLAQNEDVSRNIPGGHAA